MRGVIIAAAALVAGCANTGGFLDFKGFLPPSQKAFENRLDDLRQSITSDNASRFEEIEANVAQIDQSVHESVSSTINDLWPVAAIVLIIVVALGAVIITLANRWQSSTLCKTLTENGA